MCIRLRERLTKTELVRKKYYIQYGNSKHWGCLDLYDLILIYYKTEGFFFIVLVKEIPTESRLLFVHQST